MRWDEFHQEALKLDQEGIPYAIVTVVRTTGSSSAKTGAKVLINTEGRTLCGWVGGGCIERQVAETAISCLQTKTSVTLTIDLTDELTSVPCGGTMELLFEPFLPPPHLQIIGHGRIAEALCKFSRFLGFRVSVFDPQATPERFPQADHLYGDDLSLNRLKGGKETFAVVATHHKADHLAIKACLDKQVGYIGLIASQHRSSLVMKPLIIEGISQHDQSTIKAPCGLDMGAKTPEEIALSIMAEILCEFRKTPGKPLSLQTPLFVQQ